MNFLEKRKNQLGIKSLKEMLDEGEITKGIDESLFVHGPEEFDLLVTKWSRQEVLSVRDDKVVCIDTLYLETELKLNNIYEICDYCEISDTVEVLGIEGSWFKSKRFELIENNNQDENLVNHLAKEAFKLGSKDDKVLDIIRNLI